MVKGSPAEAEKERGTSRGWFPLTVFKEVAMGFLSKILGPHGGGSTKPGFRAYCRTEYTSTQLEMLQMGYKENSNHEIFMPDTVWVGPRSKVYHSQDHCFGTAFGANGDAIPIPESEAVRRGLHRCKRCEWSKAPVPAPSRRPLGEARPVSRCKVVLGRGGR